MSDQVDDGQPVVSKRGEAAWKEAKDRIAERNDQARKMGRQRREEKDRVRIAELREAQRRDLAEAISTHDGR